MRKLNKDEIFELTNNDLFETKGLFGFKKYLFGSSFQFKEDEDFYIRRIAEKAFELGQFVKENLVDKEDDDLTFEEKWKKRIDEEQRISNKNHALNNGAIQVALKLNEELFWKAHDDWLKSKNIKNIDLYHNK